MTPSLLVHTKHTLKLWQQVLPFVRTQHSLVNIPSSTPVARHRRPNRSGQNLSERYRRLEKMLRGKEEYAMKSDINEGTTRFTSELRTSSRNPETFMGFIIPEEPREPAADGESIAQVLSSLKLNACPDSRMLHVWLCSLRI